VYAALDLAGYLHNASSIEPKVMLHTQNGLLAVALLVFLVPFYRRQA